MGFVQEARENHVKKKVEEALRSKMKQKALKVCDRYTEKYAECAAGRTLSVVWKCRKQANELNECLHQYLLAAAENWLFLRGFVRFHFYRGKWTKMLTTKLEQNLGEITNFDNTNDSVLEQMKKEYTLQQEVNAPSSF